MANHLRRSKRRNHDQTLPSRDFFSSLLTPESPTPPLHASGRGRETQYRTDPAQVSGRRCGGRQTSHIVSSAVPCPLQSFHRRGGQQTHQSPEFQQGSPKHIALLSGYDECLEWVIFDISSVRQRLPQYPRKPTFACAAISVVKGHLRRFALQKNSDRPADWCVPSFRYCSGHDPIWGTGQMANGIGRREFIAALGGAAAVPVATRWRWRLFESVSCKIHGKARTFHAGRTMGMLE